MAKKIAEVAQLAEQLQPTNSEVAAQVEQHEEVTDPEVTFSIPKSQAHKTKTGVLLVHKGSKFSVDGKERWFTKDKISSKFENGEFIVTCKKSYAQGKLVQFTE